MIRSSGHRGKKRALWAVVLCCCLAVQARSASAQETGVAPPVDVLFTHARLLDGSGNPWRWADVGIRGDRIVFVGDAKRARVRPAKESIDLHGLYLAPGFIDLHTHTAAGLSNPRMHENLNYIMQGVTTVATGNDGNSPWPIAQTLENWDREGIGTNAALFVGFGTVRRQVIRAAASGDTAASAPPVEGDRAATREDRAPTAEELAREQELVREAMRQGAIGISTGLFYVPQSFSRTDEVIAVSKAAAEMGGIYDSHLRDEDSYNIGVKSAVAEAIEIGRQTGMPIMISHIKCLGPEVWGQSKAIVELIERARAEGLQVVANQYPYTASNTGLEAAVIPNWVTEGGRTRMVARMDDAPQRQRMLQEIPALIAKRGGAESLVLIGYAPDASLKGKSLKEIADQWRVPPAEAVLRLVRAGTTSVVSHNMDPADVAEFMKQDWVATGSDGESALPGQLSHPRSWGTFAVKLQKYVAADKLISLPFAIRAATSLPAAIAGFADRGMVAPGYFADLVTFDRAKVGSPSTYADPAHYAQGFVHVLVNGQFAVRDGAPTHVLAGRALRGPAYGHELKASADSRKPHRGDAEARRKSIQELLRVSVPPR